MLGFAPQPNLQIKDMPIAEFIEKLEKLKKYETVLIMAFNYKDLTYIRAALQNYEASLIEVKEEDCSEDEFSEIQDDIMYTGRLIALTAKEIEEWESRGPSLNPVRD